MNAPHWLDGTGVYKGRPYYCIDRGHPDEPEVDERVCEFTQGERAVYIEGPFTVEELEELLAFVKSFAEVADD